MAARGMHRFALASTLVITLFSAAHASAGDAADAKAEPPFLGGFLRESHVVYPLQVGKWKMRDEHRYEQQEAGASVRFLRDGDDSGWVDVFFYPVGVLSDTDAASLAGLERQSLLESWGKSMASHGDMTVLSQFVVPVGKVDPQDDEDDDITAWSLDFAFAQDGKPLSSAMVFAVDRLYAVKFRHSADAGKADRGKVRGALESFAREMLPRLDIRSTGGCWSPPPIEVLAKGAKEPEDALVKTDVDGRTSTWILADKVVVRDAGQVDGAMAQMLAMALTGRMHAGCAGAEPIQPDVPKGMREIRFEYRAATPAPGV